MYYTYGGDAQLHDELKSVELKHQTTSGSVGELTESLSALSDELQELKEKMDSKGDAVGALDHHKQLKNLTNRDPTSTREKKRRRHGFDAVIQSS